MNSAAPLTGSPSKLARPFAASALSESSEGVPINERGRLLDLENTRKQAMDQLEGSRVQELQSWANSQGVGNSIPVPLVKPAKPLQTSDGPYEQQQQSSTAQEKIMNAILAADENYAPSSFAAGADNPEPLLQEVEGTPLQNYDGKEIVYSGTSVNVDGSSTLAIPVKVTIPGSVVSYTIERKSYNFLFGISSRMGQKQVETVKASIS
jgi:hypothetical protein